MPEQLDQHSTRFGEVLRRYRAAAGLSQAALAARSGLSVDAIGMLERGVRSDPHNSTVVRLADGLRLQPNDRAALVAAAKRFHAPSRPREGSVPHELPRPPADFTGRVDELAALRELLGAADPHTGPVVITAIDGMGGVGKSALALQAAYELVRQNAFPDGQLYVNLHGATAGLSPLEPLEALGRMLRSLGQKPSTIPADLGEAAARFRSMAAQRRLLVVLDNAHSAEQVQPLLPGSPTCQVLITSRQVLATLEGSRALHLDILPQDEALVLLARIAGQERVGPETQAAHEVVRWCGRLPLAIRIAGARLATRPNWAVHDLAKLLAKATHRLDELQVGPLSVRASFDVTLDALDDSTDPMDQASASAFAMLSLPDGPDIGLMAASRLLGRAEADTRLLLERLVDSQLLESPRPNRYQFHDLMRTYARERATQRNREPERTSAIARLFGFYTATAWRTYALLRPNSRLAPTLDPGWTRDAIGFADAAEALVWLEAERSNLLAAITQAARLRPASVAVASELPCLLANALFAFFDRRSYWLDAAWANNVALEVARRVQDNIAKASVLYDLSCAYSELGRFQDAIACLQETLALSREQGNKRTAAAAMSEIGMAYRWLGRYDEAISNLRASIDAYREIGDRVGAATPMGNLGILYNRIGRPTDALACLRDALAVTREVGDETAQAIWLRHLGVTYRLEGQLAEALDHLQQSIAISQESGHSSGSAYTLVELGILFQELRRQEDAISSHRNSLALFRQMSHQPGVAWALQHLGDALTLAERHEEARASWEEGLAISEVLHIAQADEIRARLAKQGSAQSKGTKEEGGNPPGPALTSR